ncbi:hypothetical protein HPULCUR_004255 [Helicostylum pulchrum]|uniref:Uncharacterized protein n=1 Tax=Helicostylum pulchrum TaxID=562976 RepID=A0ABP9XVP7_9FUNG
MTDRATRTPSTIKRKSLLSELGIKSGDGQAAPSHTPTPRTRTTPPLNRRSSTSVKPSSPSVSKTRSLTSTSPRKAAPAPVKVDRTSKVSSAVSSPTSPSPNRRSIVPSSQRSSTISPLARRASLQVGGGSPNGSTVHSKRVSSPAGLDSLQEVKTMKEQIVQQELQLVEKEQEIQKLKESEQALKESEKALKESERTLKESERTLKESEANLKESERILMEESEKKVSELSTELNQLKEKQQNSSIFKETDIEHQKKRFDSLSKDYDQQVSKIKQTYENQHQIDLERLEKEKNSYVQQLSSEQTMHENFKKEQESIISDLKSQIASMEEAASTSHARKVQTELVASEAALEELKRQSLQATESLERRYRDEIRQLQSGSDDTAQAWLEKTRAAQQQVDKLHDELLTKDLTHKETIENLIEKHTFEMDQLTENCENKETEIEEQSSHIEDLLFQVETLQNSLEAATVRLEHTAKSTPTTSSNHDDINSDTPHEPIKNIHQECLNRIDVKQKELQDIKNKMKELKNTHEIKINHLDQEKAIALAELRKTITGLEQKSASSTGTSKPCIDEDRLINIAEQHRKEITTMHHQYQTVVDCKDRELEDYAYRVKALVAAKQKEVEKIHVETTSTIDQYERNIEGYEKKMKEYETKYQKLQDNVTHWETLTNNNQAIIQDMNTDCASHRDENEQLIRLVNQLQSELHS